MVACWHRVSDLQYDRVSSGFSLGRKRSFRGKGVEGGGAGHKFKNEGLGVLRVIEGRGLGVGGELSALPFSFSCFRRHPPLTGRFKCT